MTPAPIFMSSTLRAAARRAGISEEQCQTLAHELSTAIDALHRRQASQIAPGHIDAYLALRWLQWDAGALTITPAGLAVQEAAAFRGTS